MTSTKREWLGPVLGGLLLLAHPECRGAGAGADAVPLRFDQCQVIGSHNSYHVAPGPAMDALLRQRDATTADSLAYTHRSLREQFGVLGVRQIELDLYADPEGGRFATPRGPKLALERGLGPVPAHDSDGVLREPGFKIIHVPDVDFVSRNLTFRHALAEIRAWSAEHPFHFPIFVLVELKEDSPGPEFTQALPFDSVLLAGVDTEIRESIPAAQRFEPDQLRQGLPTLREAVMGKGWPALSDLAGRILFGLDNEGALRDRYLGTATNLAGRAMFVSVPRQHPAAAYMKVNDPIGSFDEIQALVRDGFLVRTRADAGTTQSRRHDGTQRDRAFASGAQFISTDYPEPNLSFSPYQVRLPGGVVARANPVSGAAWAAAGDLEPWAAETPAIQNRWGELDHARRRLAEASGHYAKALALDPAQEPTATETERARRFAPELLRHRDEPFELRDVAVVLHPDRPLIAYHLFWDDDIDFPEDNDPCDHEVIWVEYDPATERTVSVHAYFHGDIVTRPLDGARPRVAVEWGKHGSLPVDLGGHVTDRTPTLKSHWKRLSETGRRLAGHPLGRGWPLKFAGDFDDYLRLDVPLRLVDRWDKTHRAIRSRWPNAVLNQRILRYNFAAKTSWPAPEP